MNQRLRLIACCVWYKMVLYGIIQHTFCTMQLYITIAPNNVDNQNYLTKFEYIQVVQTFYTCVIMVSVETKERKKERRTSLMLFPTIYAWNLQFGMMHVGMRY